MTSTIFVVSLFGMLFLGLPIFIAMMIPSAIYLGGLNLPSFMVIQSFVGGMNKYTMLCVPFFVLAATIMGKGAMGKRLLKFARGIVGHFYGGIALTAILTCIFIGAISGAAVAGILIIGTMIVKEMEENGYGKNFSVGLVTTISAVGTLIPPSIIFVIYAINTNTSVLKLFTAGICSGLVYGLVFGIYSYIYARKRKLPLTPKPTFKDLLDNLKEARWALGLPAIILGGMYSGLFSPTEAASVSAIYAIIVEMFVYKNIDFKDLFNLSVDCAKTCAAIYVLLGAGQLLSYTVTIAKIPAVVTGLLGSLSPISILLIINLAFLIAGMFVGPGSAIVVLIPMFFPLAMAVGIDPIHLGNIVTVNLAMGMFTPPFGLNLFASCKTFNMNFTDVTKGVAPFIVLSLLVLAIITFIPQVSTVLPSILTR